MAYRNKYQQEKQQYSVDGGVTWNDVSPLNTRKGRLLETASSDCNTEQWVEVVGSWYCAESEPTTYRWVDSGQYDCDSGDKYPIEKEQVSNDGGTTWTDTGETRIGDVSERDSADCPIVYEDEPFTIEIMSDNGTVTVSSNYRNLEYKVDRGEWQQYNGAISGTRGTKIKWRGNYSNMQTPFSFSNSSVRFRVYGNVNSLFDYDTYTTNCYDLHQMFDGNSYLIDAEHLILPATTLIENAYKCMFQGCTLLTTAPALPATTLADHCYSQMFKGCSSLVSVPATLPAMTMKYGCCYAMFYGCRSLTSAPTLPAPTLAEGCYNHMFTFCSSLATAPVLPATTMFYGCYQAMFGGCTSLTTAPALPATTLAEYCYASMFESCSNLVNAPQLQAMALYPYCYSHMFESCASLETAPVLPATTFENPLIVTDYVGNGLAFYCYNDMFEHCGNLNYIKAMFVSIPSGYEISQFTSDWVYEVAATGTFVKNSQATWSEVGMNGIPYGWSIETDLRYTRWVTVSGEYECDGMDKYTKEKQQLTTDGGQTWTDTGATRPGTLVEAGSSYCDNDYTNKYLTFVALENGTFSHNNTYDTIQYSVNDGSTWITLAGNRQTPTITAGSKILWKSNVTNVEFASTGRFNVEGNIMSLGNGDNFIGVTSLGNSQYHTIFGNCTNLISAENLILPATTLSMQCYQYMFLGCTSLTTAPQLPATTLTSGCYDSMFRGCTSLVNAPALPATTLANYCYRYMFQDCTSLVNAPSLPSLSLSVGCYQYMFKGCTSLVNAPALPSTDLVERCYEGMFNDCTSLTTAPELPAINLATYCYMVMFSGCSSLNYIKAMFTTYISSSSYTTSGWVSGVAASGTFVKNSAAQWNVIGDNGVPTGWTIETASE